MDRFSENPAERQIRQFVRGAIPGAVPQPEYRQNMYLLHLYRGNGNQSSQQESILLQEVIPHSGTLTRNIGNINASQEDNRVFFIPRRYESVYDFGRLVYILSPPLFFGTIVFLRLLEGHLLDILLFAILHTIFCIFNQAMVQFASMSSLRGRSSWRIFLMVLLVVMMLLCTINGIYWYYQDQQLWRVYKLQLPSNWHGNLFNVFLVTIVTDYVVRFGTIILKCIVAVSPPCILSNTKKGRCYKFIEHASHMYRATLPIRPWIHFIYDKPILGLYIFSVGFTGIYAVFKVWSLCVDFNAVANALLLLISYTIMNNICEHCGAPFYTRAAMRVHCKAIHHKAFPYKCCGKGFRDKPELRRHRLIMSILKY